MADTATLATETAGGGGGGESKAYASERLNRSVRNGLSGSLENEKTRRLPPGHDGTEGPPPLPVPPLAPRRLESDVPTGVPTADSSKSVTRSR